MAGIAMIVTTSPKITRGIKLVSERKKTLARAEKALNACACLTASDVGPNTRSGAIETETNSKPMRAALAATLAVKNGWKSAVTITRKFEASPHVPFVGG